MYPVTVAALKTMFAEMVVKKNADVIDRYYDPQFVMYSNGIKQEFAAFAAEHRKVYATDITYALEYDDDAWVSDVDGAGTGKVAGRVWVTTALPDQAPTRIELVLIVAYLRGRIRTLWELTFPHWAGLDAFKEYAT